MMMMPAEIYNMGPFGLVYARLVEHGYSVLPIMPGTKKPGLPRGNNGEWMDFPGWPTFQPTPVHHKLWALSSAGIGVLSGPPSGYLIVIDIDTNDSGIIEALCRILPATPVKKKGARGESWFYFGPDISSHSWRINGCKVVEILGAGRQTVLPPTIHPDLGEPYQWIGSKTLEELRPQDLPRLTVDILDKIDAVLAPFGYMPPAPRGRSNSCDEIDAADDPHRRLNEAALANLAAWVPALKLFRCRPYRQGFEAVPLWRPSTTGRKKEERNRNLKIVPNGIRDFGDDKGYTAINLVMATCECDLETAFNFLDEQLGWSGDDGVLLKLETLGLSESDENPNENSNGGNGADSPSAHIASAHTPSAHTPSAHTPSAHNGSEEGALVIPLFKPTVRGPFVDLGGGGLGNGSGNGSGSDGSGSGPPAGDPAGNPAVDLEPLTYVPGRVGEIVNWIVANARLPNRLLALAAALIVVGTLVGRRCMGPTGSATHLYTAAVAPASGGKEFPRKAIPILLKAAGARAHVHLGNITSESAMNKILTKTPLCAVVRDELVSFLNRLTNPRSGGWEQSLLGMLCTLWSTVFDQFDTTTYADKFGDPVQGPAISLFGTATPINFWPLLQGTQVANGFFSRFLVFESNIRPDEQTPPLPVTVPAALQDKLAELYQFGSDPLQMAQLNDPNIEFTPKILPWANAEAEEVYRQLGNRIKREIDNDPSQEEYLGRIPEQAVRLATILAAGCNGHRGRVDTANMTWGDKLASALVTKMARRSRDCLPQTTRGEFYEKVIGLIINQGRPVTVREIQQHIKGRYRSGEINDMLVQGVVSGAIVKLPNGSYAAPPKPNKT
jgi:hypothetical protein